MNILITNDDGYNSTGLRVLAETCLEAGHSVLVVAPSVQQSATSHSMVIEKPLIAKPFSYRNIKGYAVNGFPADCVRVAPYLTDKTIDFVLLVLITVLMLELQFITVVQMVLQGKLQ